MVCSDLSPVGSSLQKRWTNKYNATPLSLEITPPERGYIVFGFSDKVAFSARENFFWNLKIAILVKEEANFGKKMKIKLKTTKKHLTKEEK